jgi:hypothetical protein
MLGKSLKSKGGSFEEIKIEANSVVGEDVVEKSLTKYIL